jgi:wyosine [tRNA(Phe)-imidazoG37] synthetase (radical SAM superfamily)
MRAGRPTDTGKDTSLGWPRDYLGNRFVYAVISQRAHGLSIGVNLNPGKHCDFDCVYCEVKRAGAGPEAPVDVDVMPQELTRMLDWADQGKFADLPRFRNIPQDWLTLKEVALSGDGEPTLSPNFDAAVNAVLGVRASRRRFFKIVLITNTSGLFRRQVARGWRLLAADDEIWVKLDAGTQAYMDQVNRPADLSLKDVTANILRLGRERPVVVQSLFPLLDGNEPDAAEIGAYVHRLQELVAGGAQISMVQIYSSHRPAQNPHCGHLALGTLSAIARQVREKTRLRAEVF